ncbi:CHRD domain-containing protein [Streptomyces sp. NPDC001177]
MSVAVVWRGTGRPTDLHIHQGAKGTNGGVKIIPRTRHPAHRGIECPCPATSGFSFRA